MTEYIVQIEDSEKNMSERFVGQLRSYPELIRCKECKHKHIKDNVWACPFGLPAGCDFYCGYGERRSE